MVLRVRRELLVLVAMRNLFFLSAMIVHAMVVPFLLDFLTDLRNLCLMPRRVLHDLVAMLCDFMLLYHIFRYRPAICGFIPILRQTFYKSAGLQNGGAVTSRQRQPKHKNAPYYPFFLRLLVFSGRL